MSFLSKARGSKNKCINGNRQINEKTYRRKKSIYAFCLSMSHFVQKFKQIKLPFLEIMAHLPKSGLFMKIYIPTVCFYSKSLTLRSLGHTRIFPI